ncbi:MAG: hypothetical protein WDZ28_06020 [Simkaniaceae bacterium]
MEIKIFENNNAISHELDKDLLSFADIQKIYKAYIQNVIDDRVEIDEVLAVCDELYEVGREVLEIEVKNSAQEKLDRHWLVVKIILCIITCFYIKNIYQNQARRDLVSQLDDFHSQLIGAKREKYTEWHLLTEDLEFKPNELANRYAEKKVEKLREN